MELDIISKDRFIINPADHLKVGEKMMPKAGDWVTSVSLGLVTVAALAMQNPKAVKVA